VHEHLFQPGHAQTARNIARRGWPMTYHAVCVVCGTTIDLLAAPSRSAGRSPLVGGGSPWRTGGDGALDDAPTGRRHATREATTEVAGGPANRDMDGDRHAPDAGCGGCPPMDGDVGE
jgi:hypothetical protein